MQLPVIEFCNVIKRAKSDICVLRPHKMGPPLLRNCLNWIVVHNSGRPKCCSEIYVLYK